MTGDAWRTPAGETGTEVGRRERGSHTIVRLVIAGEAWACRVEERGLTQLTPIPSRYEGARNGRVDE